MNKLLRTVAIVGLSAGLLTACGSESSQTNPPNEAQDASPYAAEFAEIMAGNPSDFVRAVFEDGAITPEEYRETLDGHMQCLTDAGVKFISDPAQIGDAEYPDIAVESAEAESAAVRACEDQWDGGIRGMFIAMTANPTNTPWEERIAACLVRSGLVPADFTSSDFKQVMERASERTLEGDVVIPPIEENPELPGGHRLLDEELDPCMANPDNHGF